MSLVFRRPIQIFCLGTIAALLYLYFGHYDGIMGDALDYHRLGIWLAKSNLFSKDGIHPSVARPPFYPFIISLIYRIAGIRPGMVRTVQCLLAGGSAALICMLARLDNLENKSSWAGAVCAVYPVLVAYASYVLSETLFTFLLCAGIFLYRLAQTTGRTASFAVSGATLGLACLTRSILIYFPLFWLCCEWIRTRKISRKLLVWLGACYVCVLPWTLRNYLAFGAAIPVSIGGGYALWAGAQPGQYPDATDYSAFIAPYDWESPEGDKIGTTRALRLYRANLPKVLLDLPRRSAHFWLTSHSAILGYSQGLGHYWREHAWQGIAVKLAGFVLQAALLFFAVRGAIRKMARPETHLPLALIAYVWLLVVLTDYGPNRYHVPLIPFMIYLGVHGF